MSVTHEYSFVISFKSVMARKKRRISKKKHHINDIISRTCNLNYNIPIASFSFLYLYGKYITMMTYTGATNSVSDFFF